MPVAKSSSKSSKPTPDKKAPKTTAKKNTVAAPAARKSAAAASAPRKVSKAAPAIEKKEAPKAKSKPVAEPAKFIPPITTPVPTTDKPRKNQAGLNSKDLEYFRELLLAKRRELVGDMSSMEREALRQSGGSNLSNMPLHMADMGTDNYEQEFTLGLVEKDRQLLREINQALAKIQDGSYGICEGTGKPISRARLEAQPWAKYSIEYAREMEKRPGGGFRHQG